MRTPPTEAAIRDALGDLADKVNLIGPTPRIRDAYVLSVKDPGGSIHHWNGAVLAVSGALAAAGLLTRLPDAFGATLHVRLPLTPGQVEARQAVEKGYKGRRFRVRNEWNLYDHTGAKIGYVERRGAVRPSGKGWDYRVSVDGLPPNPYTYRTLTAAVEAVEDALARSKS